MTDPMPARAGQYFIALDALDADAVSSFFADGGMVLLPGTAPISGRPAIRKALVQFSLLVEELHHRPVQLWTRGSLSVFDADVTMTLEGLTVVSFPVTHVVRWVDGMIAEARVEVYLESRLALAISTFDRLRSGITCARGRWAS